MKENILKKEVKEVGDLYSNRLVWFFRLFLQIPSSDGSEKVETYLICCSNERVNLLQNPILVSEDLCSCKLKILQSKDCPLRKS